MRRSRMMISNHDDNHCAFVQITNSLIHSLMASLCSPTSLVFSRTLQLLDELDGEQQPCNPIVFTKWPTGKNCSDAFFPSPAPLVSNFNFLFQSWISHPLLCRHGSTHTVFLRSAGRRCKPHAVKRGSPTAVSNPIIPILPTTYPPLTRSTDPTLHRQSHHQGKWSLMNHLLSDRNA